MRVCVARNFLFFPLNRVPFHRLGIFYYPGKGYDEKTVQVFARAIMGPVPLWLFLIFGCELITNCNRVSRIEPFTLYYEGRHEGRKILQTSQRESI